MRRQIFPYYNNAGKGVSGCCHFIDDVADETIE